MRLGPISQSWLGLVTFGLVWSSLVGLGWVCQVWSGLAWFGQARSGLVRLDLAWLERMLCLVRQRLILKIILKFDKLLQLID